MSDSRILSHINAYDEELHSKLKESAEGPFENAKLFKDQLMHTGNKRLTDYKHFHFLTIETGQESLRPRGKMGLHDLPLLDVKIGSPQKIVEITTSSKCDTGYLQISQEDDDSIECKHTPYLKLNIIEDYCKAQGQSSAVLFSTKSSSSRSSLSSNSSLASEPSANGPLDERYRSPRILG